uniref:Methylthioribulose-1-phosphate dehydratase n=1 Tax=Xenopus tropicalis TaxID=8364 RepID=A0A5S6L3D8_XENTR
MPAAPGAPLCLSCLLLLAVLRIHAFNLDVTNTLTKDGEKDSLFGFSVALHRQLNPDPVSWLLVGAPQASALPNQNANRTGGLYGCPLTTEPKDCIRLDIDHAADTSQESKENQWLGVTVKSQGPGGKIVTCAHLYESRQRVNQLSETRDVIGRCFVLSEDLTISDDLDGGEWKFCEGRTLGHEMFGFCQQGISAGFTTDNHYIMFGAPGTYNWKGELRVELFNQSALALGTYDDGPYEVAGEKSQKPEMIPVPHHSYFGFSVDSGWGVTGRNTLSFVSGAPRANHTGAVVILRRDNGSQLIPEVTLWGETLASSFGYSVAIEDLNNDGWMDLLVGAPNFFSRKDEIGGAVYVYMNQAGKLDKSPPLRLNGSEGSMFGIAIGSLGDINQDGFKDVAIGAPFDGNGKVYIHHGSPKGLVTKPAQILDGISVGIKTFGYSLSGGLDIDGNSYPDLLVGSLSDTVVLFRNLKKKKNLNESGYFNSCSNCPYVCKQMHRHTFLLTPFPLQSYFAFTALKCVFEAEADRRLQGKSSRVIFLKRHSSDSESQHTSTVELHKQSASHCTTAKFQLQVTVTLCYGSADSTLHKVNFLKEGCGEDKICQSNLQLSYTFCSRVGNTNQFVPLPVYKDLAIKITVTNLPSDPENAMLDGDDAHEAQLSAVFPDTLSYSGVRQATDSSVCISNVNASEATCELGNPMKRNAEITFYLIVSTPGITIETTDLEVKLELATISEQPNLPKVQARAKVILELPLSVSGVATPNRLYYSGEVKGESAMRTEEDAGSPIDIEVTVSSIGKSLRTLGSAFLNLMWPHEMMNGKWLLYPMAIQLKEKEQSNRSMECTPMKAINPLKLVGKTPVWALKKDIILDCSRGTARCVVFQCPLYSFDQQVVLKVHGRLWNSSLLEEYPSVSSLELVVRANITVKSSIKNLVQRDATTQINVMLYSDYGVAALGGIPWWIILIAVLAGILLLALLVFILWKCGFFKRKRLQEEKLPQHHAVKIPREERPMVREEKTGTIKKKDWVTNWSEDGTAYSRWHQKTAPLEIVSTV